MLDFLFLWLLSIFVGSILCDFFKGTTGGFSDVNLLTGLQQKIFSIEQYLALMLTIYLLWDMGDRALMDKTCHKVKSL